MGTKQKPTSKPARLKVPLWMSGFYTIFAFTMILWLVHLWHTVPDMHLGVHWRTMWLAFDATLMVQGFIAAYFLIKRSVWACLPLIALATLFALDMWFDFMMSVTGVERFAVLKITIAAEIPLTIMSVYSAIYILRQFMALARRRI